MSQRAVLTAPGPRFGLYYAALFFAAGVQLPFWPLWLDAKGLGATEIALFLGASTWARVLATPLAGSIADASGRLRGLLVFCAFGSFWLILAMDFTQNFWLLLGLQLFGFALFQPLIPLGESQAMRAVRNDGMDYGRARLWGSLSFILAVLMAGKLIETTSPDIVIWMLVAGIAFTGVTTLFLPLKATAASVDKSGWRVLFRQKNFLWLLLAAALLQASHAVYYAFSALHWKAAGLSETTVGLLWAEGVIAEVALFFLGKRLLGRTSPLSLLVLAGVAGLLRWTVLGMSDALAWLILVQALHALTFGAAHLGAMHLLSSIVPETRAASAQSLYSATLGATMGMTMAAAGPLYNLLNGHAFFAMALLCLGGLFACGRLGKHLA